MWGSVLDRRFQPQDDSDERNLSLVLVPLSKVIPGVGNAHLQQNPILDSYIIFLITAQKHSLWVLAKLPYAGISNRFQQSMFEA